MERVDASPPTKKRRSSERIANKLEQKRVSMENDDGFVFKRAPKQRIRKAEAPEKLLETAKPVAKPFALEVVADVVFRQREN